MKIELEINDIEVLSKALNNALTSYGDIVFSTIMRCNIPLKFEKLKDLPDEELMRRVNAIKDIYKQIEKIEERWKNNE